MTPWLYQRAVREHRRLTQRQPNRLKMGTKKRHQTENLDGLKRMALLKEIRLRNDAQKEYYELLCDKPIVFAEGPAGTGKTFLACARAVELIQRKDVDKIYLVRPAVESEEELGYLPGDIQEKLEPYLTPLHDNLQRACTDWDILQRYLEVAPLAYMRGRTFNNCVVLVDEAQNMSPDQMLMLLTRLGVKCYCFVMGDLEQGDLVAINSGLEVGIEKLRECPLVGVKEFAVKDVVRSKLVQAVYQFWFSSEDEDDGIGFRG